MKKLIGIGSMIIIGGLLTGCGETEGRITAAEEQKLISEAEHMDEQENTGEASKVLSPLEELELENKRKEEYRAERLASRTVYKSDSGYEYFAVEDYYLTISEFKNVKEFTNYMPVYWEEQKASFPDNRSQRNLSEAWAARCTVSYINWFKEEIEELGLTEVFNEWQMTAYEFMKIQSGGEADFEKHDKLAVEYEKAMLKAVEAINNLEEEK